ncbi:MAG: hypothetical protein ABIJ95_07990 [Pseudomonadota bacterium]
MRSPFSIPFRPASGAGGFTLLEILLAVGLFGLLASVMFAAFDGVVNNTRATDRIITRYGAAQACMARITADLQGMAVTLSPAYSRPEGVDDQDPWQVEGKSCSGEPETFGEVRFATSAHLDLAGDGRTGVAQVRYYVTEADLPQKGWVLRRSDLLDWDLFEPDEILDPVLCPDVKRITFTFYDKKGDAREEWNSESEESEFTTPRAVEVILEVAVDGDGDNRGESGGVVFTTRVELPVYRDKG